jgi:arylformamidase
VRIIDLTLELKDGSLSYPGTAAGVELEQLRPPASGSVLTRFAHLDAHCGTHLDAPLHFVPEAADVATLPLMFPEIVVIPAPEGPIPVTILPPRSEWSGRAVLFSTGWERFAGTKRFFAGFPYLETELAQQLIDGDVALVGLDSPSVDGTSGDYPVHRMLLSAGIPIIEGLTNLTILRSALHSGERARLAAFPLRVRGLEGSVIRAVAIVESV